MLNPGDYPGTYKLVSGELCLDFVNTVSWRGTERHHDWLGDYSNLALWGQVSGLLTEAECRTLIETAKANPEDAERALQKAHQMRAALNTLFNRVCKGEAIPPHALQLLNTFLPESLVHLRVGLQDGQAAWTWSQQPFELERVLWPVAWSAANLLMSPRLAHLRACEACEWLFLDTTRNHSRRWCTMEDCGNRAKVRRFRDKAASK